MAGYVVPCLVAVSAATLAASAIVVRNRGISESRVVSLSGERLFRRGESSLASRRPVRCGAVARELRRAGIEMPASVWIASVAAVSLVVFAFSLAIFASVVVAVALVAGCVAASFAYVKGLQAKRRGVLCRQFVRALPQISASVRSSLTLDRAMRVAAEHAEEPLREELVQVLAETAYGSPIAAALDRMARRTGCADVASLAAALGIQSRFGGPVAGVIDLVADHANARMKAERALKTELAGTRLAKWFVAASMPAIFLIMFASNSDFSRFYREEPLGWALLAGACAMEVIGLEACRRITSFTWMSGAQASFDRKGADAPAGMAAKPTTAAISAMEATATTAGKAGGGL